MPKMSFQPVIEVRQSNNSNGSNGDSNSKSSGGKNSEEWGKSSGQSGDDVGGTYKFELDEQEFSKEEEELFK